MEVHKVAIIIGIFAISVALIVVGLILYSITIEEEAPIYFSSSDGRQWTEYVTQEKQPFGLCGSVLFSLGFIVFILAIVTYFIIRREKNDEMDQRDKEIFFKKEL